MPRKKSENFEPNEYIKQYGKEFIRYKKINFNLGKEDDVKILNYLDSLEEGISPYLKRLIRLDIEAKQK